MVSYIVLIAKGYGKHDHSRILYCAMIAVALVSARTTDHDRGLICSLSTQVDDSLVEV